MEAGYGGPVWHCSAAGGSVFRLRAAVRLELSGVGDASLGEWTERSPHAFHLRRRLSADEQLLVGDVVDVRGIDEGRSRFLAMRAYLPAWFTEPGCMP